MSLKIRVYNVGFGDACLISWKENSEYKHILVDFGNAYSVKNEPYYTNIINDIKKVTNSKLDLLVCTHLHLDHYEGFYKKLDEFKKFKIKKLWMPYIEEKTEEEIETTEEFMHQMLQVRAIRNTLTKKGYMVTSEELAESPSTGNKKWESIKKLVKEENLHYLNRTREKISDLYPKFKNMTIEVLGPEEHTGFYTTAAQDWIKKFTFFYSKELGQPFEHKENSIPKKFLKSFDFKKLDIKYLNQFVEKNGDIFEYADKMRNNTSLVLRFVYKSGGKTIPLLLSGDAQFESWQKIFEAHKRGEIKMNARFLKVSHHGSHNGTSKIIAKNIFTSSKSKNTSVISTMSGVYGTKNPVPHKKVIKTLKKYSKVVTTEGKKKGQPVLITYK